MIKNEKVDSTIDTESLKKDCIKKLFAELGDYNILKPKKRLKYIYDNNDDEIKEARKFLDYYKSCIFEYDEIKFKKLKEILLYDKKFNPEIEGKKKYISIEEMKNKTEIFNYIADTMDAIRPTNKKPMKADTIKKWFTRKSMPKRGTMFWMSFALDLPIIDDKMEPYSHQALFYKVFGQVDRTRSVEDICMIYCKKNGLSYETALELYEKYKSRCKENKEFTLEKIHSSDDATRFVYREDFLTSISEEELVEFLITNQDILNANNTSIISCILSMSEKKQDDAFYDVFDKKYRELLSGYVEDGRLRKHEKYNFANNFFPSKAKFHASNRDDIRGEIISDIIEQVEEKKLYGKVKKIEDDFIILDRIILYKEELHSLSKQALKEQFYGDLRKKMIIVHFISYWTDYLINAVRRNNIVMDREDVYEHYIQEINMELQKHYLAPLYPYNDFDLFILLCSGTNDPVYTYYYVLSYMYNQYFYEINEKLAEKIEEEMNKNKEFM